MYNQNLVDIVLLLINNAYKIRINFYVTQEDNYNLYRLRKIVPGGEIDLLKAEDHFDSLPAESYKTLPKINPLYK